MDDSDRFDWHLEDLFAITKMTEANGITIFRSMRMDEVGTITLSETHETPEEGAYHQSINITLSLRELSQLKEALSGFDIVELGSVFDPPPVEQSPVWDIERDIPF